MCYRPRSTNCQLGAWLYTRLPMVCIFFLLASLHIVISRGVDLHLRQCCACRRHALLLSLVTRQGAVYCGQPVCLCVSVCLSIHEHISETAEPICTQFGVQAPVAVARSSSGGVAIRYVFPILWMTSRLAVMGRTAIAAVRYRGGV